MEITTMTFITLSILFIAGIYCIIALINALDNHDKLSQKKVYKPLDNRGKWWYN